MEQQIFSIDLVANVILRTTIIFLYAFLLLRFLGKRHLRHLMYTDLLVVIAFGSAVGDVMIYGENIVHLYASMIAITVVTVIVKLLEELGSHAGAGHWIVEGRASLLVDRGQVRADALAREHLSEETLLSLLREKGVGDIATVRKAFMEPDGKLSVITYERDTPNP